MADLLEVPEEINAALELVRENRLRLEAVMSAKVGFDAKHAAATVALAGGIKQLSTEGRLWAEVIRRLGESASPEQRTAASVAHLLALPQGLRAAAYRSIVEAERTNRQPLQLSLQLDAATNS